MKNMNNENQWIKSKIKMNEGVLTMKTTVTNKKTSKCVNGIYDDLPEIFHIKMSPVQLKANDIATSESASIQ